MTPHELGRRGEDLAASFLEGLGYRVLERQYRFERAEVDLVCFAPWPGGDGGEIVFVEVKARRGTRFGEPEESVTEAKKRSIMKAAEAYLYERKLEGSPARFDVVAIAWERGEPLVRHYPHAFGMFF